MLQLELITGEELLNDLSLLDQLAKINSANDRLYTPTLRQRFRVEDYSELELRISETYVKRAKEGSNFIIAKVKGEVVGYNTHKLGYKTVMGVEYRCIEIGTTCVHPSHQNQGIGHSIYSLIEGLAIERYNAEAVTRSTWSTNLRQMHLYEQFGYTIYTRYYNYYGVSGLDKLDFVKVLKTEEPNFNCSI